MITVFAALVVSPQGSGIASPAKAEPKYIVFMVPDGMGISNVTAARTYKNGMDGESLNFERLPYIGYQRTHSRNSTITDSAAAASAWASGEKFNNGEISCLDENRDGICDGTRKNPKTILEMAEDTGLSTGLVATAGITHATPAVWGAHVHHRDCESEIFKQYLDNGIEVLLGGGIATNRRGCMLGATDDDYNRALIAKAVDEGYLYATTKSEMIANSGADKLLGIFNSGGLSPIYRRSSSSTEPTLKEMTETALKVLEKDPDGFFLMVEGSQIDTANHANDMKYQIMETLDFDDSVKVVMDWMDQSGERKKNTLLIVAADHETAGFAINGPYGVLARQGDSDAPYKYRFGIEVYDNDGNKVMAPCLEAGWTSAGHTAEDVLIWSNSPDCAKAMDNTELFGVLEKYLTR